MLQQLYTFGSKFQCWANTLCDVPANNMGGHAQNCSCLCYTDIFAALFFFCGFIFECIRAVCVLQSERRKKIRLRIVKNLRLFERCHGTDVFSNTLNKCLEMFSVNWRNIKKGTLVVSRKLMSKQHKHLPIAILIWIDGGRMCLFC